MIHGVYGGHGGHHGMLEHHNNAAQSINTLKQTLRGGHALNKKDWEEQRRRKEEDERAFAEFCERKERERQIELAENGGKRLRVYRRDIKEGKQHLDGFENSISKTHAETRRSALKERAQLLRHFVPGFVISLLYEYRSRMRDAFTVMDRDGSRELDKDELEAGLEEVIGIRLNNAEMNVLFYIIDRDGSGTVEYHELMSALRNAPKIVYVTFDEFHEGLAKLGYPLRPGFERKLWEHMSHKSKGKRGRGNGGGNGASASASSKQTGNNGEANDDDGAPHGSGRAERENAKVRRCAVRFIDLHRELKPLRDTILKDHLISRFPDKVRHIIKACQDQSNGRWNLARCKHDFVAELLQKDENMLGEIFQRFKVRLRDLTSDEPSSPDKFTSASTPRRPPSPATTTLLNQELLEVLHRVELEHIRRARGEEPPPPPTPQPLEEKKIAVFVTGYVKNLIKGKLMRVRDIFAKMDVNGDGTLSSSEFCQGLQLLGIKGISKNDVDILIKAIDIDGDGTLTFAEANKALSKRDSTCTVDRETFYGGLKMLGIVKLLRPTSRLSHPDSLPQANAVESLASFERTQSAIDDEDQIVRARCDKLYETLGIPIRGQRGKSEIVYEAMVDAVAQIRARALAMGILDTGDIGGVGGDLREKMRAQAAMQATMVQRGQVRTADATSRRKNIVKNDAAASTSTSRTYSKTAQPRGRRRDDRSRPQRQVNKAVGRHVKKGGEQGAEEEKRLSTQQKLANHVAALGPLPSSLEVTLANFPIGIQNKIRQLYHAEPRHIMNISQTDWETLKILDRKQQDQVLQRMARRLGVDIGKSMNYLSCSCRNKQEHSRASHHQHSRKAASKRGPWTAAPASPQNVAVDKTVTDFFGDTRTDDNDFENVSTSPQLRESSVALARPAKQPASRTSPLNRRIKRLNGSIRKPILEEAAARRQTLYGAKTFFGNPRSSDGSRAGAKDKGAYTDYVLPSSDRAMKYNRLNSGV